MSDAPVIDPQTIENLRALNPDDGDEFLREIVGIFIDDTPNRIRELEQSHRTGDVATFTRAAHSIKGSAANMGASALKAVASALEQESRANGLAGVAEQVRSLRAEFTRAQEALRAIVRR